VLSGWDGERRLSKSIRVLVVLFIFVLTGCGEDKEEGLGGGLINSGESPFVGEGGDESSNPIVTPTPDVVTQEDTFVEVDVSEPPEEDVITEDIPCDDGIPCTIDTVLGANGSCSGGRFLCGDCVGSACVEDADCAPFLDGNACNGVLECKSGVCRVDNSSVITCDGILPHLDNTRVLCNPVSGQCEETPLPDGQSCDDSEGCTLRDRMINGVCVGVDVCLPCVTANDGDPCDDGDSCTTGTTCVSGRCIGDFACECESNADCTTLEDGNLCNGKLQCVAGSCQLDSDSVIHCQRACPTDSCYQGTCLEEFGVCVGTFDDECEGSE